MSVIGQVAGSAAHAVFSGSIEGAGAGAGVHVSQPLAGALPSAGGAAGVHVSQPFAGLFESLVKDSTAAETKAQAAVSGLMNGSGVELHEAMIATQKADMTFELALQVRNKAVAGYQQMMSMQF